jgi:pilus assembly protein CpaC
MIKIVGLFLLFISCCSQGKVLQLGESLDLPLGTKKIWIEKGALLKAENNSGPIRLTAKQVGATQIRLNGKVETIQILHPEQIFLFNKLSDRVKTLPGLQAEIEEGHVVIKGYLHSFETWKSIAENLESPKFRMRATFSEDLKMKVQDQLNLDLIQQGLLGVNLITSPRLEVRLNPKQPSLERYQKYFQTLGVDVTVSEESLELVPIIRVDITVVELQKDSSHKFGIQWPHQVAAQIFPTATVAEDQFLATLQALEESGQAKTLASPNLLCRSGREAEFLAGGEIPITIMNFRVQDIIWKRYGVFLKIKPVADSSGRISLTIETEVSSLDNRSKEGVPSLFTNRVSSHFDLGRSQVVALSGLLQEHEAEKNVGLPSLQRLPILGALFSSRDYQRKRTELVIFVRPRLLDEIRFDLSKSEGGHVRTSL